MKSEIEYVRVEKQQFLRWFESVRIGDTKVVRGEMFKALLDQTWTETIRRMGFPLIAQLADSEEK